METKEDFLEYEIKKYLMDHSYTYTLNMLEDLIKKIAIEELIEKGAELHCSYPFRCKSFPFCFGCNKMVIKNESD